MPVTPTGLMPTAMKLLGDMVAASSAFQTEVGAANATEALTYIHKHREDDPAQDAFACIYMGQLNEEPVAGGSRNYFRVTGTLELELVRKIGDSEADDYEDIGTAFLNWRDAVWANVRTLAAASGYLNITSGSWEEMSSPLPSNRAADRAAANRTDISSTCTIEFQGAG